MTFELHPEIEDLNMQVIYDSDCNKIKLQFMWNAVIGYYRSKDIVMMDPYNLLEDDIHKDIVGYGV